MDWTELKTELLTNDEPANAERLADLAEQAAGWLVEPAVLNGRLEMLTASIQLGEVADLLVDRDSATRPYLSAPSSTAMFTEMHSVLQMLVIAAAIQSDQASSREELSGKARYVEASLLLDEVHHALAGSRP